METAEVFQDGHSQAVRLPKRFRFKGNRVYIKRVGHAVILMPYASFWDALLESLAHFSTDFMSEREQPPLQERRTHLYEIYPGHQLSRWWAGDTRSICR